MCFNKILLFSANPSNHSPYKIPPSPAKPHCQTFLMIYWFFNTLFDSHPLKSWNKLSNIVTQLQHGHTIGKDCIPLRCKRFGQACLSYYCAHQMQVQKLILRKCQRNLSLISKANGVQSNGTYFDEKYSGQVDYSNL